MCRLFGLVANKKVNVKFSFSEADLPFKELGSSNPDGWGIWYYENGNPKISKESNSIEKSLILNDIIKQKISNIFVSHVRKSFPLWSDQLFFLFVIINTTHFIIKYFYLYLYRVLLFIIFHFIPIN